MSLAAALDVTASRERVVFRLAVENASPDAVELRFPSARTVEVVVRADGEEAWRWSEGRMFAQALREETLAPGETAVHEAAWDDPEPGEYEAEASLASAPSASARASFSV
ncbi:MAG: BsuPI-related putative proteinase inhibitor [Halobacteriaceae archaeon]